MKTKILTLLLAFSSWGAFAQHDHSGHAETKTGVPAATFKDARLGAAYTHYLQVKDALVLSNSDLTKKHADELQKALKEVSGSAAAQAATQKVFASSDLQAQRVAFSALSNEMATLVKGGKLTSGTLYLEYCPMANNSSGAYWLSSEKEIKNPYFGDMMLKCGSVKETIQ